MTASTFSSLLGSEHGILSQELFQSPLLFCLPRLTYLFDMLRKRELEDHLCIIDMPLFIIGNEHHNS